MNELKNHTVIGIIGRISSGKSTKAKKICENYKAHIMSFGKYLFDFSKERNLPTDRDSLQNLGEQFIAADSTKFFQDVLNSQPPLPEIIIIEGIRHKAIYDEIKRRCEKTIFAFIDVPIETRYDWYRERKKEGDKEVSSLSDFKEIDTHPVENEIDSLKILCDMIITSDWTNEQILASLDKKIESR